MASKDPMSNQNTAGKRKHVNFNNPSEIWKHQEAWTWWQLKCGYGFTQHRYKKREEAIMVIHGIMWKCENPLQVT
jgi:hypothetical protein